MFAPVIRCNAHGRAKLRGKLVEAAAEGAEWAGVLRTVRAGMLAVPSRVAARLPHLSNHDIAEIESEIRAALSEIGGAQHGMAVTGLGA